MKDLTDLLVWIWSLVVLAFHYAIEACKLLIIVITSIYSNSYHYMTTDPTFQSVPHLGKVLISGVIAGIVPFLVLSLLRALIPAIVRGHLQESGLDRLGGSSSTTASPASTSNSTNQTEIPLRPYVTYEDPSVHVSRLRKGFGNSWTAEIRKGNQVTTINIGQPTFRGTLRINTFGSNGTVEWGN